MLYNYYNKGIDRYNPGKLVKHKWENAMTLGLLFQNLKTIQSNL